jgi:NDP-sugar pyrophosphorylase family protein
MQAAILAGGKGTRLRPLTYKMPKPMISIHGRPFLEYQLELIAAFGINKVLLLVSYLGEKIEEYFGNGSKLGLQIEYSYEINLLGTGGALKNAENKLKESFLLINGDTFLPIDYGKLIEYFYQCGKIGVVTVYTNSDNIVFNNIAVSKSNIIVDYNKHNSKEMTHVDAGASVFSKKVLDIIPNNQVCSLEEEIFPKLIKDQDLFAFPINQRFYDMGDFTGLEKINQILK